MGAVEKALSPRIEQIAFTVKDDYRLLAAVQDIKSFLSINADTTHV